MAPPDPSEICYDQTSSGEYLVNQWIEGAIQQITWAVGGVSTAITCNYIDLQWINLDKVHVCKVIVKKQSFASQIYFHL